MERGNLIDLIETTSKPPASPEGWWDFSRGRGLKLRESAILLALTPISQRVYTFLSFPILPSLVAFLCSSSHHGLLDAARIIKAYGASRWRVKDVSSALLINLVPCITATPSTVT